MHKFSSVFKSDRKGLHFFLGGLNNKYPRKSQDGIGLGRIIYSVCDLEKKIIKSATMPITAVEQTPTVHNTHNDSCS